VDDSPLFTDALVAALEEDDEIEVVATAADGLVAVERVVSIAPDVVTMDLTMPGLSGLEAISRVMARRPTPILVLTGDERGSAGGAGAGRGLLFDALARGALDLRVKPNLRDATARRSFAAHVKLLAGVKTVHHPASTLVGRRAAGPPTPHPPPPGSRAAEPEFGAPGLRSREGWPSASVAARLRASTGGAPWVVGLAASTGGPSALAEVLGALPRDLPAAILVVQHLEPGFAATFTAWLASASSLPTFLCGASGPLVPGTVVVAAPGTHLTVGPNDALRLEGGAPLDGHRPSATVLFRSMASACPARAIGVVLTGMGADGAAGLLELRGRGGVTIAEDARTATVDGMPRAAREAGAAALTLPRSAIGAALVATVRGGGRGAAGGAGT
jgi:two-component system chemotaxis response regulator CheB